MVIINQYCNRIWCWIKLLVHSLELMFWIKKSCSFVTLCWCVFLNMSNRRQNAWIKSCMVALWSFTLKCERVYYSVIYFFRFRNLSFSFIRMPCCKYSKEHRISYWLAVDDFDCKYFIIHGGILSIYNIRIYKRRQTLY